MEHSIACKLAEHLVSPLQPTADINSTDFIKIHKLRSIHGASGKLWPGTLKAKKQPGDQLVYCTVAQIYDAIKQSHTCLIQSPFGLS